MSEQHQSSNTIAIIGLGYTGLPLALNFASHYKVIGYDINCSKIEQLKNGIDPNAELPNSSFENLSIDFTCIEDDLAAANIFIVAVPTPVSSNLQPDLQPLRSAMATVGCYLTKGDAVIVESTVYPGCTEEFCLPILEAVSGLKVGSDFGLGYSPERINPGDKLHTVSTVKKIIAASDDNTLSKIGAIYSSIIKAGVVPVSSIKVAEAAKIVENVQRDANIALMNQFSLVFDKMNLNTYEVLEAASTKWNFLPFHPGLAGGHCIAVDPYYLLYKANEIGVEAPLIEVSRAVNESMVRHVVDAVLDFLKLKELSSLKVLVKGITFKAGVSDVRNSKIVEVVKELLNAGVNVEVEDPFADAVQLAKEHGISLVKAEGSDYSLVLIAVSHENYKSLTEDYFLSITNPDSLIFDLNGIYRNKIKNRKYKSL